MPELADRLLTDARRWQTALDQLPDRAAVRLDPVSPDPVSPDPVSPDPVSPDPVSPDPVSPDPVSLDPVSLDPPVPRRARRPAGAAKVLAAALAVAVLVAGVHIVRARRQAGSPATGVTLSPAPAPAPTHLTSPAPPEPAAADSMTPAVRSKLLSIALEQARMLGGGPNVTAAAVLSTKNQDSQTSLVYGSDPVWLVQVYGRFACDPTCFTVSSTLTTAHILTLFVDRLTFATDGFRLADAEPLLGNAVNLRTGAVLAPNTATGRPTYLGPVTEPTAVDGTPLRLAVPAARAPRLTPQQAYEALCAQDLASRDALCTDPKSSTDIRLANLSTLRDAAPPTPAVLSYLITNRSAECVLDGVVAPAGGVPSVASSGAASSAASRSSTCTVFSAVNADTGQPASVKFVIPAN